MDGGLRRGMWVPAVALALACQGKTTAPVAPPAGEGGDDVADDTGAGVADSGDTGGGAAALGCPAGLVPVPAHPPDRCVMAYEAVLEDGVAVSLAGVMPAANVTLSAAVAACEATPVVDLAGESHGFMRLATLEGWRDAGDGVAGEGGSLYPWGDGPHDGQCALDDPSNPGLWSSPQPTGSLPECVSAFGAYDQLGNLWEWVDAGLTADVEPWAAARQAEGWDVDLSEGTVRTGSGTPPSLQLRTVCIEFDAFFQGDDGALWARLRSPPPESCPAAGEGYLIPHAALDGGGVPEAADILPVRLAFAADGLTGQVLVAGDRDGEPAGAKVGGSYYSGGEFTLLDAYIGHIPSFDGTIGFRCESDPFPLPEGPPR